jgi:hypothetical protein
LFASFRTEEMPAMPVNGTGSVEFRGDLIFIGVGFLIGLVLISLKGLVDRSNRVRSWGLDPVAWSVAKL